MAASEPRILLFPVDNTDYSQKAFEWMLKHFYKPNDEIHLLYVISRVQYAAILGVPAVDYTPQINRDMYEAVVKEAEAFIVKRFLTHLSPEVTSTPVVHIVKSEVDASSVGHVVCFKAEELKATCVLMSIITKAH
eukprot:CAMPEP_0175049170 /NCGR_PEP_ID=MMETSP0052_2-20121109/6592_1 /TAXON_ID=51329 ORGANISM="Polytomella parva, Strain SAG 63-3" /NCGR_SAMPLE_ID=MMETSP0052_2 /ASSEMBLY_ACC=CAM_ASM_000194 /LENGTH=134 /DNA_ID=CAMNT_0016313307 /DNA_START=346 /DNA_END=751 /DNA_ORIENTATION=+